MLCACFTANDGFRGHGSLQDLGPCPDGLHFGMRFDLPGRRKPLVVLTRVDAVTRGGPFIRALLEQDALFAAAGAEIDAVWHPDEKE